MKNDIIYQQLLKIFEDIKERDRQYLLALHKMAA